MNQNQKKLVEIWFVMISLFIIVGVFEENEYIARGIFIPVVIYFFLNYETIKSFENSALTVKNIIANNKFMSLFTVGYLLLAIIISFYFLFSGKDLGKYLDSFWSLALALGAPLIVPIIVSQKLLFIELGKNEL
jgi:predicted membrane protein